MIACLDSGNTRIKWGVHDGRSWLAQGALAHSDLAGLAALPAAWPAVRRVMLANVAGPAAAQRIATQLGAWAPLLNTLQAVPAAAGVVNDYQQPARLGVDRWCALVGARALTHADSLVVMAGTATTIDTLRADGHFAGGLILPGLDLMRRALARDTAGLPFADGHHVDFPRCTDDAIVTGTIEAQAGAIERAFRRLGNAPALCLLSGGNASVLSAVLGIPHRLVENLPLEGMRCLAADPASLN